MSESPNPSGELRHRQLDEVAAPAPAAEELPKEKKQSKKPKRKSLLPVRRKAAAQDVSPASSTTPSDVVTSAEPHAGRPVLDSMHPAEGIDAGAAIKQEVGASSSLEDERRATAAATATATARTAPSSSSKPRSPIPRVFREKKDLSGIELSTVATKIYTVGYLVLFSILGVLARLGLQSLTFYPNAPVQQGLVWANFAGSFVMGFLSEDRKLFRHEWGGKPLSKLQAGAADDGGSSDGNGDGNSPNGGRNNRDDHPAGDRDGDTAAADALAEKKRHGAVKKTIPLFVGLATGFCGSCTSFSSFQRDTFLILANSAPSPETSRVLGRNGGYSFLGVLASLLLTPALSLAALQGGAHLALALDRRLPSLDFYFLRGFLDPVASFVGYACWLGAVFMAIWPPDRPHGPAAYRHETWEHETWRGQAIFACVFAPLGTLVRYYASMALNPLAASFPCGTFAVNIGGTLLEALFFDLQHAKLPLAGYAVGGGRVGCQVLQGLQDGLCGCLTTVSTWVAELKGLRRRHAYLYASLSLLVGLAVTVVVMGSLRWTHGFYAPQCVT